VSFLNEVVGWLRVNWPSVVFTLFMLLVALGVGLVLAHITDIAPLLDRFFSS
jgi:hypothetical protein